MQLLSATATLRPFRGATYSVMVQASGPAFLPPRFGSFHVIGVPLAQEYPIARGEGARRWMGRLAPGDVSIHAAGPGEAVCWPDGARCLYVHLHPRTFGATGGGADARSATATLLSRPRLRDGIIRELGRELVWLAGSRSADERAAERLIDALTRHLAARYLDDAPPAATLGRRDLGDVLDELRAGGPEVGSMTDVARSCGLTRAHFTRTFRAATGWSPYGVLLGSRLERAKHLLTTGRRSISETAYECGFADQSHLARTFVRITGMTPVRFRAFHQRTSAALAGGRDIDRTILQDHGERRA